MRQKKQQGNKEPLSYSKKIFLGVTIGVCVVIIYSLVVMAVTLDLTPLAYLIPAAFAELATATGFYYNKAKAENTKGGIVYEKVLTEADTEVIDE